MPHRRLLRFAAVLLLAWIAVDLTAVDTCALDVGRQPASAHASVAPGDLGGPSTHPQAVLHPDHCFCHGLSTGADTTAALIDPSFVGRAVYERPAGHPLRASAALYHPPQLSA